MALVTPLANEEKTINEFLERVLKHLNLDDRIYCVIDKICTDSTKDKVAAWSKKDSRVVLVWVPKNYSLVDAFFRGYREALNSGAEWILEIDGGLSHLPEEIPRFIQAMKKGYDFVAGSRFVKRGKYVGFSKRHLLSRLGSILSKIMLGTKMKDITGGFECFTRETLKYVVNRGVKSKGHFFHTEIRSSLEKFNWTEVPITYANPSNSVKSSTIVEALNNLWKLRKEKNHD